MSKTLLLADDSVTIQKVVGISFANEDVRIVTVDNGDDAVARAREIRPDIVLADVVMPGKSGYDVCAALKSDPELRGVPVLLLTGTFETFDEDRAARVGADGHITKPFEAQALVQLVNERLASASAARVTRPGAAPAPKPASPEPEPFDFLEPEEVTLPRAASSAAPDSSFARDDAFAFEAVPLEAVELETEDESDLGIDATEARTALLMDDEPAFAETARPVAAASLGYSARHTDFDDADELTRLVLPESPPAGETAVTESELEATASVGDPLDGVFEETPRDHLTGPGAAWDVSTSDLGSSLQTRVLGEPPAREPEDVPTRGFAEPIFDDDPSAGDEFELTPPAPTAEPAPLAAPSVAAGVSGFAPQLRDQVHETLEKVAWESFGDLSERIVREAVQRIEQVAWDVIPRLAETLIREEIRKLKGEE